MNLMQYQEIVRNKYQFNGYGQYLQKALIEAIKNPLFQNIWTIEGRELPCPMQDKILDPEQVKYLRNNTKGIVELATQYRTEQENKNRLERLYYGDQYTEHLTEQAKSNIDQVNKELKRFGLDKQ